MRKKSRFDQTRRARWSRVIFQQARKVLSGSCHSACMLWFQFSDWLKRQKERQSLLHLSHLLQILINLITSFKEWKLCQATWGIRIKQRNLFLLSSLSGEDMNVVPIVMEGANYSKLAIPGSYINVMDFQTVKQFAEYLQYLAGVSISFCISGYLRVTGGYICRRP